jgi:hypothetical protein
MFCDLKGATVTPRLTRQRQIAATVTLFPTWDADPITNNDISLTILVPAQVIKTEAVNGCIVNKFKINHFVLRKYGDSSSGNAK